MKTQAVLFPKTDSFEMTDITLDEPGVNDIVVRTLVSSISPGTERWILRGRHMGTQFPLIPGYHRIGVVESAGKDVSAFKTGDVVYGCGNRWKEKTINSMWGAHVGMSVSAPAGYNLLSHSMLSPAELESLSFSVVIGVAVRGIRFLDPKFRQSMVIIGGGIIGVCAAMLAQKRGCAVAVLEPDTERRAFIQKLLPLVLDPADTSLEEKLKAIAPNGFDHLYDSVGHAPTTDRLVKLMRSQGTVLLQAQYFDKEKCAIDIDQIKLKELTIKTTCGTRDEDWHDTTTYIRDGYLPVTPLITQRFGTEDILTGYELLSSGKPFNLGMVFNWNN
ncbi:MAG: zinc-binding dehydrogenase [Spirochaetota bacterium]